MEMLGRVPVRGVVTASDVSAPPANAEVNPRRPQFQAFLASARARLDVADAIEVTARLAHDFARQRTQSGRCQIENARSVLDACLGPIIARRVMPLLSIQAKIGFHVTPAIL
jgi:hypothetical protein